MHHTIRNDRNHSIRRKTMSNSLMTQALASLGDDVNYHMTFINHSKNAWNFCCYQRDPEIEKQGAIPAAWFVKQVVHPTTTVDFQWTISYGLSWSQSGKISPGIIYKASQDWGVGPDNNMVTLSKIRESYTFEDQRLAEPKGVYKIYQSNSVVRDDQVSIGISMRVGEGGKTGLSTIYAQDAQPNVTTQFRVTPSYWVVFAQSLKPSQILDVDNFTNAAEVKYNPGVYSMTVELDEQNKWHIDSLSARNQKFLQNVSKSLPGLSSLG